MVIKGTLMDRITFMQFTSAGFEVQCLVFVASSKSPTTHHDSEEPHCCNMMKGSLLLGCA